MVCASGRVARAAGGVCVCKEVLSESYYAPTTELFDWGGIASVLEDHFNRVKSNRPLILVAPIIPSVGAPLWRNTFRIKSVLLFLKIAPTEVAFNKAVQQYE